MMAGTKFTMVPYKGGTTLITGLLAGDIPLGHRKRQRVAAALARPARSRSSRYRPTSALLARAGNPA